MAERCPTCGSSRQKFKKCVVQHHWHSATRPRHAFRGKCVLDKCVLCTDPWHGVASEPAPTPPVWDECVGSHDEAEPAATPEQPIHQQNCAVFWNEPCNCGIEWKVPIKAEPAPTDIDHCPKCGEYLHDEMGHMCAAEPAVERPTDAIQALRRLEYVSHSQAQQAATLLDGLESELSSLRRLETDLRGQIKDWRQAAHNRASEVEELEAALAVIADLALGNGDVCEIIARRARKALSTNV